MASGISLAKVRVGRIRHLKRGVRAVLKSDGVAALLGAQAARAAARCNSLCDPELRRGGARYSSETVQRGYTAGGLVYAAGSDDEARRLTRIDNFRNNTLKKGCGV